MPTKQTLQLLSPAKLNLHLEVHGKRDDGFHELETLMTTVSIYDTMRFQLSRQTGFDRDSSPESIQLNCRWAFGLRQQFGRQIERQIAQPCAGETLMGDLPSPEKNLVWRTVELMRDEVLTDEQTNSKSRELALRPISIDLVKRIPSAAGLGGASSNSATTILALNRLWELDWQADRMAGVAAQLGSDIPFFIRGRSAVCRGRGELIEPVRSPVAMHAVVVRPPVSLSTADVFGSLNCDSDDVGTRSAGTRSSIGLNAAVQSFSRGHLRDLRGQLFNRLQHSAMLLSDRISQLRHEFEKLNFIAHQMTGSGSCWFGICENRRNALAMYHRLRSRNPGLVYVCQSC